jgi:hypothetical protein
MNPAPRLSGISEYTVGERKGRWTVSFACIRCHSQLESPLDEAGQTFPCPTCGSDVTTPGQKELQSQLEDARAAETARQAQVRQAQETHASSAQQLIYASSPPHTPAETPPSANRLVPARPDVPNYEGIVTGNDAMSGLATLVRILAAVYVGIALLVLVWPLTRGEGTVVPMMELVVSCACAMVVAATGITLLILASLLRMLGALGLAMRDMAINSFR